MTKFVSQLVILAAAVLPDNKLHVVFCNVGQGDATLVTYRSWQMLVDVGPNSDVLNHGSKTGMIQKWLNEAKPELAVISVGKNSFGHSAPEILKLLGDEGIEVLRTDQKGDSEIISDGRTWSVK